jgi:site-specific recombinase XerC
MNASEPAQGTSVLLHHLHGFRLDLRSQGYSDDTIRMYLASLTKLDAAAAAEGNDLRTLVERHLNRQPLFTRAGKGVMRVLGFHAMVSYLARKKLLAPRGLQAELEHLLSRYTRHLAVERRLRPASISVYVHLAERFLRHCFKDELRVQKLSANEILSFLSLPGHSARHINAALKAFLRFLFQAHLISKPFAEGLPAAAHITKRRLPRALSPDQIEALLASFPESTPKERRDQVIAMIMARLGLRPQEAASLLLADIDWAAAEFIVRGKGGYEDRMPLPADVAACRACRTHPNRPPDTRRRAAADGLPHEGRGPCRDRSVQPRDRRGLAEPGYADAHVPDGSSQQRSTGFAAG